MITANQVYFSYPGSANPALANLDFSVDPGEIFGLLGPSGAGKTTAVDLLTGTLRGWTGSISVKGIDPSAARADFFRNIGVSFESPRFHMKFTALENLRFFGSLYNVPLRDPRELLSTLSLSGEGNKRVEQFSKGMKTRLSLARALLHDPGLLFLDEPTEGLDPALSREVRRIVREERDQGKTVFLTTHDMTTAAELCDRVGFLVEGRLKLIDQPRALALRYGRPEIRVEYREGDVLRSADFPLSSLTESTGFQNLLAHPGLETLHTREAGLGDIFLQVTGRALG